MTQLISRSDKLPESDNVQNICCLMLAEIGDILVTTPTIEEIKKLYPHAKLSVIIRKPIARLLEGNPHIDELILYDNSNFLTKSQLLLRLLFIRIDLWVDLHTPTFNTVCSNDEIFARNHLIQRFARPKYSIGFCKSDNLSTHSHGLLFPDHQQMAEENIVSTTMRLVRKDYISSDSQKYFHLFEQDKLWALQNLPSSNEPFFLGIFFGSKQSVDIWPEHKVSELIHQLFIKYPISTILLLGGSAEKKTGDRLKSRFDKSHCILNFCGSADLGQTGSLMTHCKLVVSTDSGPMHIADAMSVPLVTLFSSKNYLPVWLPVQSRFEALNIPVSCGPCFQSDCHQTIPCIEQIEPESVVEAITRVMEMDKAAI
ncbi:glycosyltransferase family 9 protein [Endozoicomonas arenosclerae]|uniref:glycosyltransferase family 9 protein n=1 Tax=Endozoicomonas arenosclerae TaxID=1633495 RepID=UPI000781B6EF|nr:glycosyltransferase family 9 protein [Endozoicomonas arenosclerae]